MILDQFIEVLLELKQKGTDGDLEIRINGKDIDRMNYLYSQDSSQIYEEYVDVITA